MAEPIQILLVFCLIEQSKEYIVHLEESLHTKCSHRHPNATSLVTNISAVDITWDINEV